jgi:hypothetical protein
MNLFKLSINDSLAQIIIRFFYIQTILIETFMDYDTKAYLAHYGIDVPCSGQH